MSTFDEFIWQWDEHYGVRLFEHEDDWGWTVFGAPRSRDILAAINRLARENGVRLDLSEAINDDIDNFVFKTRVAMNVRTCEEDDSYYTWDWSDDFDDLDRGGVLMTVVTLQ
ncbi:hypothetical protein I0Q12_19330 [Rhodococcus sp. CX]|uniref:hypothetical protein n=1 Tax=Rhodococcus sp. CX TaxID=2789880 RepID=UPI0018CCC6B4|nr:hypothetical protein [Rhodococcus sp. CX]MBH0121545.1 hypothetical protein [Rhodococcus sp. CX]